MNRQYTQSSSRKNIHLKNLSGNVYLCYTAVIIKI